MGWGHGEAAQHAAWTCGSGVSDRVVAGFAVYCVGVEGFHREDLEAAGEEGAVHALGTSG